LSSEFGCDQFLDVYFCQKRENGIEYRLGWKQGGKRKTDFQKEKGGLPLLANPLVLLLVAGAGFEPTTFGL
jgi:hypothetical protein